MEELSVLERGLLQEINEQTPFGPALRQNGQENNFKKGAPGK